MGRKTRIVRRKQTLKFNPKRDYINQAVEDYLKNGGKITKLEFDEKSFVDYMQIPEAPGAVDEFLAG